MQKRSLVMLAGLLVMLALMVVVSCAPAPTPQVVKETVPVPQTVVVKETVVVPQTVAAPQPTVAPAATAAPKPAPPVAVLKIVPVAADKSDPNVVTATLKYITDTAAGPATTTLYFGAMGLPNVAIGFPVHVNASVADPKNPAKKFVWTLTAPVGSKAAFKDAAATDTEFTPDVPGIYKVDVVASNDAGNGPMASVQVNAGTYIGVTAGNCKQCHSSKFEEWSKTAHATKFTREINGGADPATSRYSEYCARGAGRVSINDPCDRILKDVR